MDANRPTPLAQSRIPDGLLLADLRITRDNGPEIVSLTRHVPRGQVLTIMAPSGAGKTTLLMAIAGHLAPAFQQSGRILVDGKDLSPLPPHRRGVGLVFQDALLFPHLSVGGNLMFSLPRGGRPGARRARAASALAEVGLSGFFDRDPASLSGGQKARVALLRTILAAPRVLLLDEPFTGLDAATRQAMRKMVFDHVERMNLPALLVTHEREDARAAGGDVIDTYGRMVLT